MSSFSDLVEIVQKSLNKEDVPKITEMDFGEIEARTMEYYGEYYNKNVFYNYIRPDTFRKMYLINWDVT